MKFLQEEKLYWLIGLHKALSEPNWAYSDIYEKQLIKNLKNHYCVERKNECKICLLSNGINKKVCIEHAQKKLQGLKANGEYTVINEILFRKPIFLFFLCSKILKFCWRNVIITQRNNWNHIPSMKFVWASLLHRKTCFIPKNISKDWFFDKGLLYIHNIYTIIGNTSWINNESYQKEKKETSSILCGKPPCKCILDRWECGYSLI